MAREVYLTNEKLIFEDEGTARDSERLHELISLLEQKGFNKAQIKLFLITVAGSDFAHYMPEYDDEANLNYLLGGANSRK